MSKGFTLAELIVYIALLSLVVVAVIQVVLVVVDAGTRTRSREEVLSGALRAMDAIRADVRASDHVYAPTSTFGAHPGQLSLAVGHSYTDFFVSDDGRLCANREGQAHQCITSPRLRVTDLQFTYAGPSGEHEAVQTRMTLEYTSDRQELRALYTIQSTDNVRAF